MKTVIVLICLLESISLYGIKQNQRIEQQYFEKQLTVRALFIKWINWNIPCNPATKEEVFYDASLMRSKKQYFRALNKQRWSPLP